MKIQRNHPRQGRIRLRGEDVTAWPPYRIAQAGVGLVPPGREIFPALTVQENIMLAARSPVNGGWTLARVLEIFPPLGQRWTN